MVGINQKVVINHMINQNLISLLEQNLVFEKFLLLKGKKSPSCPP